MFLSLLDNFIDRFKTIVENDPGWIRSLCLLATAGGQPVGGALCSARRLAKPGLGWINMLGVRRAWRKRGVGKACCCIHFLCFRSSGHAAGRAWTWMRKTSPARCVYMSQWVCAQYAVRLPYLKELRPGKRPGSSKLSTIQPHRIDHVKITTAFELFASPLHAGRCGDPRRDWQLLVTRDGGG